MAKELTWNKAIERVLEQSGEPQHYNQIAERIVTEGLRQSVGATPAATVSAVLSTSMKNLGENSPYRKVSKGTYVLREVCDTPSHSSSAKALTIGNAPSEEEQYAVISSFGMFWRREAVVWSRSPKLLGMQKIGASEVNFCDQIGIYLLYDGREVIYVGQSKDRPMGLRLYEHTIDRLSARWDRFSWFGLLPVSEQGKLGEAPASVATAELIPALEAILIEALEPRQNRKRGDDLAAVEFLQKEDSEIEKRRVKNYLADALQ